MKINCIIIGAGATGLMAAYELTKAGHLVTVLEARHRSGGRIYTTAPANFSSPVELGAEFIHGDLPLTSRLLKLASILYQEMEGDMYRIEKGKVSESDFFEDEWELLLDEMKKLKSDMTLQEFLNQNFPLEKYGHFQSNIKKFVEGYNAADITKASTQALHKEWSEEEDPTQYRPVGGYYKLIDFLIHEIEHGGGTIHTSAIVKSIQWKPGEASVRTEEQSYTAEKVMITVPFSVLDKISITPEIANYREAAKGIGFGSVIKYLFEFHQDFWNEEIMDRLPSLKFLFTDAMIPTWWSQLPDKRPLLTGWLGGPSVKDMPDHPDELLRVGISSLAYILNVSEEKLRDGLKANYVVNWLTDPFACGAYSYATLKTEEARKFLNTPIAETIFFAGESLYEGAHTATVEAALTSGQTVAHGIIEANFRS